MKAERLVAPMERRHAPQNLQNVTSHCGATFVHHYSPTPWSYATNASQAHSPHTQECACEVWSRDSHASHGHCALANTGTRERIKNAVPSQACNKPNGVMHYGAIAEIEFSHSISYTHTDCRIQSLAHDYNVSRTARGFTARDCGVQ